MVRGSARVISKCLPGYILSLVDWGSVSRMLLDDREEPTKQLRRGC